MCLLFFQKLNIDTFLFFSDPTMPKRKAPSTRPSARPTANRQTPSTSTDTGTGTRTTSLSKIQAPVKKRLTAAQARAKILDSSDSSDSANNLESETDNDDSQESDNGQSAIRSTPIDGWTRNVPSTDSTFQPSEPIGSKGAAANCSANTSTSEFFALFWGDDMWQLIVDNTNLNASRVIAQKPNDYYARQWSPLTIPELKAFVGLRLSMEYGVIKRRYEHYFSRKTGFVFQTPGYRKVMTRDRYLAIWKFLHVVDEEDSNIDKQDKLYKILPLLNNFICKSQENYKPDQDLSLDEGMIPAKNRLSIKQYIASKPVKWGIKSFLLCESKTGYVYNVEVYAGKTRGLFVPEIGATGSVVARLTTCVESQNYKLYMDRYYNSPGLSRYLLERKIHSCGTIMTNRKGVPRTIIRRNKDMKRGDFDFLCNDQMSVIVWCDRKPLYFITTFHDPSVFSAVNRKNKDGTVQPIPCPQMLLSYNQNMGGCDKNDQMTKLYKSRKHYRWPRRMMLKCLTWTCYNAYVIQQHYKPQTSGRRLYTFYDFLDELVISLIGDYRSPAFIRRRSSMSVNLLRLQNVGEHMPDRPAGATGNNRCIVCREKARHFAKANPSIAKKDNPYKESKTVFRCSHCNEFLCIREGSNCWSDYHKKVEYWR